MGHREYTEDSIDTEFWREVFGADVIATAPKRIGEGQVGMNLRYQLTSDDPSVPASVVVKMASPDPTSRATGVGLRNYEREVKFYNEVASSLDVRKPHCYFADWNEAGGDIAIVPLGTPLLAGPGPISSGYISRDSFPVRQRLRPWFGTNRNHWTRVSSWLSSGKPQTERRARRARGPSGVGDRKG